MERIARVIVDRTLGREFDYRIPSELADVISIGSRVSVPFGRASTLGYVVALPAESPVANLKPIQSVLDDKPFVSEDMIDLVRWMAAYYCATVEQALRTVLPSAVRNKQAKQQLFVQRVAIPPDPPVSGKPTGRSVGSPGARKITPKQQAILDCLDAKGGMLLSALLKEVGTTVSPIRTLEKKNLVSITTDAQRRDPLANRTILPTKPLALMKEQDEALQLIKQTLDDLQSAENQEPGTTNHVGAPRGAEIPPARPKPLRRGEGPRAKLLGKPLSHVVLLYGVTGSGKTEVYLQAIDRILKQGKGAIVLVPEISLTPQTVERFVGRFGDRIAVLHSHLSDGERHDEWYRIRDGKANVVIGARSAVFAPVVNLGLIVVDEEHEPSYKQEDAPRYNARDVAVMRGHRSGCAVVLGSATPSLESWHNALNGKYRLAKLPHRADHRTMPAIRVIDMRVETERSGHVSVFSKDLLEAIRLRIDRAEQTILFLNRRGFATSLVCPKCGYVASCDNCSVSYTFHRHDGMLRCHICGQHRQVPAACPSCGDPAFRYAGVGTQRVESILHTCFPKARIQRMDADVTTRKEAYDEILGDFRVGKTDILLGTQMIAKGLHFPNVTLVGVIYADLSLHMPDFRAGERTFQLLAQVAGRAGRGDVAGEVIVQTYTPFHVAVQAARRLDYEGFCDQEFEFRKELLYPPFAHLVCITLRGRTESKVSYSAATVAGRLRKALGETARVAEATPAPLARARGQYRYQVMLRSTSARVMADAITTVLKDMTFPDDVGCSVDMDAMSLL